MQQVSGCPVWQQSRPGPVAGLAGRGVIKPYVRVVPASPGTRGGEAIALAESIGLTLDPEQQLCLNDILAVDEHGKLAAYRAGVSMPRQTGKSVDAEIYSLFWALEGQAVLYTSHRVDASRNFFRRILANLPGEHDVRRSNGQEEVVFDSGGGSSSGRVGRERAARSASTRWCSMRRSTSTRSRLTRPRRRCAPGLIAQLFSAAPRTADLNGAAQLGTACGSRRAPATTRASATWSGATSFRDQDGDEIGPDR